MQSPLPLRFVSCCLLWLAVAASAPAQTEPQAASTAKPKDREASIRAVAARVGVGEGSVVADVGAGKGQHTWTFADIVGSKGSVYAEEITDKLITTLEEESKKRKLEQVRVVKGGIEDPNLPEDSVDLVFLRFVYHHFGKPRPMLRGIWRSLKPGGHLVVVDRQRGTLRDWIPREQRTKKHAWLAETTVVREAREEGFQYVECAEECWHEKDPFVLVFRRPLEIRETAGDPDRPAGITQQTAGEVVADIDQSWKHPVLIALGQGRQLIEPILDRASGQGVEVVLEEWATQKDERPSLPEGVSLPASLTELGDPQLDGPSKDAVFFLDTYHLLFHADTLLTRLHSRLTDDGFVYILDRRAEQPLSRREASHQRRICPEMVKQEMESAGFRLRQEKAGPTDDRFVLVFEKTATAASQ